jgi:holo-[acyl-carrier protein] synthase
MQVDGVGIDIVEVSRIARMMKNKGFLARVFTKAEIRECQKVRHPEQAFAARFAAKEAVGKALGTGVGGRVGWRDIEIIRRPKGKPMVVLSDKALSKLCRVRTPDTTQNNRTLDATRLRQVGTPDATKNNRTLDTTCLQGEDTLQHTNKTPDATLCNVMVSMSHTEEYAVAVAIIKKKSESLES